MSKALTVTIKHGKKKHKKVEINPNGTFEEFQEIIFKLTAIPIDRQKIIAKGKKIEKDTDITTIKAKTMIIVMGSTEKVQKKEQQTNVIFIDGDDDEKGKMAELMDKYFEINLKIVQEIQTKEKNKAEPKGHIAECLDIRKISDLKDANVRKEAIIKFNKLLNEENILNDLLNEVKSEKKENESNLLLNDLHKMTKQYLVTNKKWATILVEKQTNFTKCLVESSYKIKMDNASKEEQKSPMGPMAFDIAFNVIDKRSKRRIVAAEEIAVNILKDLDKFTKELFDVLDVNKNHKIEYDQFQNGFCDAICTVFSSEKLQKYSTHNVEEEDRKVTVTKNADGSQSVSEECIMM